VTFTPSLATYPILFFPYTLERKGLLKCYEKKEKEQVLRALERIGKYEEGVIGGRICMGKA
jgi:hypothetical protein